MTCYKQRKIQISQNNSCAIQMLNILYQHFDADIVIGIIVRTVTSMQGLVIQSRNIPYRMR